ncbi:MAG: galactose mutarotase [Deinococcales bacterium]
MSDEHSGPGWERRPWGATGGREAWLYTLRGEDGAVARISDDGGRLVALELPGQGSKEGVDVVLGLASAGGAVGVDPPPEQGYLGALIGRVANRIADARFELDGRTVVLEPNDGDHLLHGGAGGFHARSWSAQPLPGSKAPGLALSYLSADGEGGFPGRVWAGAAYRLGPGPVLRLELSAVSDTLTPVSLTHHPYFNLAGHGSGDVLAHELTLYAERFTPTTADLVPTGEVRLVAGTPFDLRSPRAIGQAMGHRDVAEGYDVNVVVDGRPGTLRPAARLRDPASGRSLELWTTQPGLQVYTGNGLDGTIVGKGGVRYGRHAGIALEAQAFPNAVNLPHFPQVWLRPGAGFRQVVEYRFTH